MKSIKYIICSILFVLCIITNVMALSDLEGHWANNYIDKLVEDGVINGYPDGSFRPEDNIKLGEYLKICVLNFTDTSELSISPNEHWALPYYDKAIETGILIAKEDFDLTNLEAKISRGQIARILGRIAKITNTQTGYNIENESLKITDYKDIPELDKEGVLKMLRIGAITGYTDGSFKAEKKATRAELCAMIHRFQNPSKINSIYLDSNIRITEGDGKNENYFTIIIDYYKDVNSQLKTAELYLSKQLSIKDLEEVMNYIAMKEETTEALPMRYFDWKNGKIMVNSPRGTGNLIIMSQ